MYSKDKKQLIYCPPGVVEYAIPPFVQEIAWLAFRESGIAKLVIPSTVKTIGPMAFENARIGEIRIENGLKEIDAALFNDCGTLRTLVIPNSVTSIVDSGVPMFVGCERLVKVRMPMALRQAYEQTWEYLDDYDEDLADECINRKIEYTGADGLPVPYGFVMSGGMSGSRFCGRFPFAFNSLDLTNEWLQFAARLAADMATHRLSFTMMQDSYKVVESNYGIAKVDSPDAEIPDYRQAFELTDPLAGEDMQVLSFKPAEMSESQAETVIEFLYPKDERPDGDTTPTRVYAQRLLRRLKCSEDVGWNGDFDFFDPSCCYWQDVDLVLPEGIAEIAAEEYAGARRLRTVKIPEGVVKIGDGAFYACSELERVEFPSTLREIGLLAFSRCVSLGSLELPKGIKKIGKMAFDEKWYKNVPQLQDAKARVSKKKKGRK